ncbi:MAG: hypothetical protein M1823_006184 [Watsoniomyces obsoletus]|nr:MAG: hypothetical protein M1823_006184 [Watsoniomyces obsoletus]
MANDDDRAPTLLDDKEEQDESGAIRETLAEKIKSALDSDPLANTFRKRRTEIQDEGTSRLLIGTVRLGIWRPHTDPTSGRYRYWPQSSYRPYTAVSAGSVWALVT